VTPSEVWAGNLITTQMTTFLILFQGGLGALGGLVPMLLIIGVFYMLLIRPQQKRQRELQETISQLKAGDRVVTTGGIIGTITTVRDTSFFIRSADKSILEIARSAVAGIEGEEKK
jgi:preprotein translocase subunit YajC